MSRIGRPPARWRVWLHKTYGLSPRTLRKLSVRIVDQLDGCSSAEARRLVLGVSEKYPAP